MDVNELIDVKQFFRSECQIREIVEGKLWGVNSTHNNFDFLLKSISHLTSWLVLHVCKQKVEIQNNMKLTEKLGKGDA